MNEKVELNSNGIILEIPTKDYMQKNTVGQKEKCEKKRYISSFGTAFENYNSENIKLLITNGADIKEANYKLEDILSQNDWMETNALAGAIENNDTEVVELLLKNGFDIKRLNILTKIEIPCKNGNLALIKLLIEHGLDINHKSFFIEPICTLLEICVTLAFQNSKDKSYFNISKYLIEKGADVNIGNLLFKSLKTGKWELINHEIAELLINNGADVNDVDTKGRSILMTVCNHGNDEDRYNFIKLLIEHGVNINYQDKEGNTALILIDMSISDESKMIKMNEDGTVKKIWVEKHEEVVMNYKVDVVLSSEKIMELLIDNGADINIRNNMGMTPLMKYSLENNYKLVNILLKRGADVNIKSEVTAFDLSTDDDIKILIEESKNNNPQKLVKLLSNFTIDKPIKYTTHFWDFGELKNEYVSFDGYMDAVRKQFLSFESELKDLSENLHKKIYTFLLDPNPDSSYSWCTKTDINIGWSSLDGLREHCDDGKNAFDYKLQKYIVIKDGPNRKTLTTFGDIVNLFKEEIEMRIDSQNLVVAFNKIKNDLDNDGFIFDITNSKLQRQFYTDTQNFVRAINKIFLEIKKRKDYLNIELTTKELDDRSLEIRIVQVGSLSSKDAESLLSEVEDGDFADIKTYLNNLCDWSIESSCDDGNYRLNYLHSNNVKQIIRLNEKPNGFTHILKFYR